MVHSHTDNRFIPGYDGGCSLVGYMDAMCVLNCSWSASRRYIRHFTTYLGNEVCAVHVRNIEDMDFILTLYFQGSMHDLYLHAGQLVIFMPRDIK